MDFRGKIATSCILARNDSCLYWGEDNRLVALASKTLTALLLACLA